MKDNWLGRMAENNLIGRPRRSGGGLGLHDRVEPPRGHLSVKVIKAKSGDIVQVEEGLNVVTNGGREALAHLFAGDDVANKMISSIQFGDGTGVVDISDVALFGSVIITKPVTPTFPVVVPPTQVVFTGTVGQFEGNGAGSQDYREAGLLCGDTTFATHKVFGLITKTSDLVIEATWTFTF